MNLDDYQRRAAETAQLPTAGPGDAVAPMLGLASETGAILNVYKKFLRDKIDLASNASYLEDELGDLLWYTAAVATAFNLSLADIAQKNLARTHDYFLPVGDLKMALAGSAVLDEAFPLQERFPRRLVFALSEQASPSGALTVETRILSAEPYAFAAAPHPGDAPQVGFRLGEVLGAQLTNNSRREDAYRFHDAIHIAFASVLGWSPVLRRLLHLKRRSDPVVDEVEDGARSIFVEEGLATMLSQLAVRRLNFQTEPSIDMETIDVIRAIVADLEVAVSPAWLWRRAVHQGFTILHDLERNHGGMVIADLDARTTTFRPMLEGSS